MCGFRQPWARLSLRGTIVLAFGMAGVGWVFAIPSRARKRRSCPTRVARPSLKLGEQGRLSPHPDRGLHDMSARRARLVGVGRGGTETRGAAPALQRRNPGGARSAALDWNMMMKEHRYQGYRRLGTEHRGGEPRIRPYILYAIFGVCAVPVAILRSLIEVWDCPGRGRGDPGAGQEGSPQVQKYPR